MQIPQARYAFKHTPLLLACSVSAKYAQEHQMAVIDCLEDPDETLKLKTLELLVTMTKANNVQVGKHVRLGG